MFIDAIRVNDVDRIISMNPGPALLTERNNWAIRAAVDNAVSRDDNDLRVVEFLLSQPSVDPRPTTITRCKKR
jgi:hypothetical protein